MDRATMIEVMAKAIWEKEGFITGEEDNPFRRMSWEELVDVEGDYNPTVTHARDQAEAALAALEAAGVVMVQGWQPIETAPKDGTHILISNDDYDRVTVVYWEAASAEGGYYYSPDFTAWTAGYGQLSVQPAHWMPLPEAPAMLSARPK